MIGQCIRDDSSCEMQWHKKENLTLNRELVGQGLPQKYD